MVKFSHVIQDPCGLHARPVTLICACVRGYESSVRISCGAASASATDLMELMGLMARKGDELEVKVEGADEDTCAAALRETLASL